MKETILVTGGTGFIGSHTTVELQQAGYDVVIVDNLSNSSASVVDGIEKITGIRPAFEQVDCCDYANLEGVFQKYSNIKGIIHFAASKAVGESVEKPLLYYRNNLNSLINLLELMPKYDVKGIIFSSSCTVYGQPDPEFLPVTEEALMVSPIVGVVITGTGTGNAKVRNFTTSEVTTALSKHTVARTK